MGIVCYSLIGLCKVLTVEFTSAGTWTTFPWLDNCLPLGSSRIYINGIRGEINLSSKGVKFKRCGFRGNPILFAVEQTGSFLLLRFDWLVKQIRFALSIIAVVVTSKVAEYLRYLFASHFLTDDRYHNWSEKVHTYSGPLLMLSWNVWMTFVIVIISCIESWSF